MVDKENMDQDARLFERVAGMRTQSRDEVFGSVSMLRRRAGLDVALTALYRQQVNCGFVLTDPLDISRKDEKRFFDAETGITFRMQWNPDRELRRNHKLLIKRKIIDASADPSRLVNRGAGGKPCYLCKRNIGLMNPKEVQIPVRLGDEDYFIGANFASITDNHFTVMNAEHRPQAYRETVPRAMNDFLDATKGAFRIVFNGLAGASIKAHEHFQATTEPFPVEEIKIQPDDLLIEDEGARVLWPMYHTPLCVVEGRDRRAMERRVHEIVIEWEASGLGKPTENILATRRDGAYRMFVFLRDESKLTGPGKKGVMATFEAGGILVMSYRPQKDAGDIDEGETFREADVETVRSMLRSIAPEGATRTRVLGWQNAKDGE